MKYSYEEIVKSIEKFINNINIENNETLFRKLANDLLFCRRDYENTIREWKSRGGTLHNHPIIDPLAEIATNVAWMDKATKDIQLKKFCSREN